MDAKTINKDIANLVATIKNMDESEKFAFESQEIKEEFFRIYRADKKFELMNKKSVLLMMRMNLRFRFEPLHMFGIYYDL